jgi:hypothetical protein
VTAYSPQEVHLRFGGTYCFRLKGEYATGWATDETGFDSQQEEEVFLFFTASRLALGPAGLLYTEGEGEYSPWGKGTGA